MTTQRNREGVPELIAQYTPSASYDTVMKVLHGVTSKTMSQPAIRFLMKVGNERKVTEKDERLRKEARGLLVRHATRPHIEHMKLGGFHDEQDFAKEYTSFFSRHPHHAGTLQTRDREILFEFLDYWLIHMRHYAPEGIVTACVMSGNLEPLVRHKVVSAIPVLYNHVRWQGGFCNECEDLEFNWERMPDAEQFGSMPNGSAMLEKDIARIFMIWRRSFRERNHGQEYATALLQIMTDAISPFEAYLEVPVER